MNAFDFMSEHWLVTFLLALIAANLVRLILYLPYRFYKLHVRRQNIAQHGWPTAPLDADGDVVYPPEEESEQ